MESGGKSDSLGASDGIREGERRSAIGGLRLSLGASRPGSTAAQVPEADGCPSTSASVRKSLRSISSSAAPIAWPTADRPTE